MELPCVVDWRPNEAQDDASRWREDEADETLVVGIPTTVDGEAPD